MGAVSSAREGRALSAELLVLKEMLTAGGRVWDWTELERERDFRFGGASTGSTSGSAEPARRAERVTRRGGADATDFLRAGIFADGFVMRVSLSAYARESATEECGLKKLLYAGSSKSR